MKTLPILRVIKFAFQHFWRNFALSLVTITIISITLTSVNVFLILRVVGDAAVETVRRQIDVSLFFDPSIPEEKLSSMQIYVQGLPGVTAVELSDKEQVLAAFKEKHKDEPAILSSLDELEDNPLGATMVIKSKDPAAYRAIVEAIEGSEYASLIQDKTFDDHEMVINKIVSLERELRQSATMVTLFFTVVAFLVIFNTVRMAIYTERDAIGIQKLVGATNWFIRGPFFVEGVLLGFISLLISMAVLFVCTNALQPYIIKLFGDMSVNITRYFIDHFFRIFSLQFLAVGMLTIFSALIAMRRYLRV